MIGDGRFEGPESEISVLLDSAPGEDADFQPKKEVILFPGVFGRRLYSVELGIVFPAST